MKIVGPWKSPLLWKPPFGLEPLNWLEMGLNLNLAQIAVVWKIWKKGRERILKLPWKIVGWKNVEKKIALKTLALLFKLKGLPPSVVWSFEKWNEIGKFGVLPNCPVWLCVENPWKLCPWGNWPWCWKGNWPLGLKNEMGEPGPLWGKVFKLMPVPPFLRGNW